MPSLLAAEGQRVVKISLLAAIKELLGNLSHSPNYFGGGGGIALSNCLLNMHIYFVK